MSEEANQLSIRLVTPERTMCELTATAVELPAKNGYFEVLYGHAPLVAELGAGDVIVHSGADITDGSPDATRYNVSWGFVEVLPDRVTILANDALKPEEIDVPRAEQQLGARPGTVEGSRRKRRRLHRRPPRHLRSRSQNRLRTRQSLGCIDTYWSDKHLVKYEIVILSERGPKRFSVWGW